MKKKKKRVRQLSKWEHWSRIKISLSALCGSGSFRRSDFTIMCCTAWCREIGSLESLDAPELHADPVTSKNQVHCTRLYITGTDIDPPPPSTTTPIPSHWEGSISIRNCSPSRVSASGLTSTASRPSWKSLSHLSGSHSASGACSHSGSSPSPTAQSSFDMVDTSGVAKKQECGRVSIVDVALFEQPIFFFLHNFPPPPVIYSPSFEDVSPLTLSVTVIVKKTKNSDCYWQKKN